MRTTGRKRRRELPSSGRPRSKRSRRQGGQRGSPPAGGGAASVQQEQGRSNEEIDDSGGRATAAVQQAGSDAAQAGSEGNDAVAEQAVSDAAQPGSEGNDAVAEQAGSEGNGAVAKQAGSEEKEAHDAGADHGDPTAVSRPEGVSYIKIGVMSMPLSSNPPRTRLATSARSSMRSTPEAQTHPRARTRTPPRSRASPAVPSSSPAGSTSSSIPLSANTSTPAVSSPTRSSSPQTPKSSRSPKSRLREKMSRSPPSPKFNKAEPTPSPVEETSDGGFTKVGSQRLQSKHKKAIGPFKEYLEMHGSKFIEQMWQSNSFTLKLPFQEIRQCNKEAAYDICNYQSRSLYSAIHDAAQEYVFKCLQTKSIAGRFKDYTELQLKLIDSFKLIIDGLPRRIKSINSTIKLFSNKFMRVLFRMHRCHYKVAPMTEDQMMLLIVCLDQLLDSHAAGFSWNGEWTLNDWDWLDNCSAELALKPSYQEKGPAHHKSCKKDLQKFTTEFLPKFKIENRYPAYLGHLYEELQTRLEERSIEEFFSWYQDYLRYHPSILPARVRLIMILGWYFGLEHLGYKDWAMYERLRDGYFPWTHLINDFPKDAIHKVFWDVYWNKNPPVDGQDPSTYEQPYQNTFIQCHSFLRQICEHAFRYTKIYRGYQSVDEADEPEVFIADKLEAALPEFIKYVILTGCMSGEFWHFWKMAWKLSR